MTTTKEPPDERDWVGRIARWAAEPYLAFKNDHLRLYALIARDIRKVLIVGMALLVGPKLPWRAWISFLN